MFKDSLTFNGYYIFQNSNNNNVQFQIPSDDTIITKQDMSQYLNNTFKIQQYNDIYSIFYTLCL